MIFIFQYVFNLLSFNRTKVECKSEEPADENSKREAFNRTKVECKQLLEDHGHQRTKAFNRTKVECK